MKLLAACWTIFLVVCCVPTGAVAVFEPDTSTEQDLASLTYTIWVHDNVTEKYTLSMHVERNTSFYNVMKLATQKDPHYQFEALNYSFGHYITTLAGYKEDPAKYYFWMLYKTPEIPDPASPPDINLLTPVGVDEQLITDGDNYLFWLKML